MKISKETLKRIQEEAEQFAIMRQQMFISPDVVLELIENAVKAEQAEKEAQWFAEWAATHYCPTVKLWKCKHAKVDNAPPKLPDCANCWRAYAQGK